MADYNNTQPSGSQYATGVLSKQADKVLKSWKFSRDSFENAREESERAVRYLNNDTWTSDEKTNAKKYKKPTLKYNIITPIISTLVGNEQLNRRQARFKPTTVETVAAADIVQQRWNALQDEQDIEDKLQIAFIDALTTKLGGWIERSWKMSPDGYLDFKYEVLNNFRVYIDPETRANDYQLNHCRWIVKEGWEALDVISEKYSIDPYDVKVERNKWWWNALSETIRRVTDKVYSSNLENYDKINDRYRILEMQERVTTKMVKLFDGVEYTIVSRSEYRKLRKDNPGLMMLQEFDEDKIHVTTIIPYFKNLVVKDEDMDQPTSNFDVFPVWSYNYNVQVNEQTSLVDLLLDIQDDVNKAKSQVRDYVTQILSGGTFIDKREKETIKALKEKGNQPNMVYELNNPAIMPQKLPPGTLPPDIMLNAENSVAFAQRVSLVSEAMKGETARSGESGVLFEQKVQRAAAAINPYFKNLSRLRKALAKDFMDNFGHIYAEKDRVIKIKDENVFNEVIVNLETAGKMFNDVRNPSLYVELDEGESNITNIEENFNKMLALSNMIGQINPALVDIRTLVESAPIPGAEKFVEFIDQTMQAQMEAQGQQSELAQQQAEIEKTKGLLENVKTERGMMNDEEKLRLEDKKINQQGVSRGR
tara:strand:- start:2054 stop:4000 length:1947 start_codon:yes stop_codon:yes gene_type:complete